MNYTVVQYGIPKFLITNGGRDSVNHSTYLLCSCVAYWFSNCGTGGPSKTL